jgi:hypothetical protein
MPVLDYARSPVVSAIRVGERFGVVVLAACEGGARYVVQTGVGYLGLCHDSDGKDP